MFTFRRPTEERVRKYLLLLQGAPLSYGAVGCTRDSRRQEPIPSGFNRDHKRVLLGTGEDVFRRACGAMRRWQMMPPSVVQPCPAGVPIE